MSNPDSADPIDSLLRSPSGGIPGDVTIESLEKGAFDVIATGSEGYLLYAGPLVDLTAFR